jgi:hypothetical protein
MSRTLAALGSALQKGLDPAVRLGPKEMGAVRAAAQALFPPVRERMAAAFAKRGVGVETEITFDSPSLDTHPYLAALRADLARVLRLEPSSWQGLELGFYFGFDATGCRDRLVWGVSGQGDKEWIERCTAFLQKLRRPDEPFLRSGEPLFAGGGVARYLIWGWDCPPKALSGAKEATLVEEVSSRLEDLIGRLLPARSGAKSR